MKKLIILLLVCAHVCAYGQRAKATNNSIVRQPTRTYATWNANDKSANITLSNGNLTAQSTVASTFDYQVHSTLLIDNDKVYIETQFTRNNPTDPFFVIIGLSKRDESLDGYTGKTNGVCITTDGNYYINGSFTNSGWGAFTDGDIVGVEVDLTGGAGAGIIKIYKNDVLLGTISSTLTGPYWFGTGTYQTLGTSTTNFGATPFTYTGHTTYKQGLYVN